MTIGPFDVPAVPLEEPVLVFTLALVIFLVSPLVIKRFGFPGIVGIVLVGAALGPGGIGLVEHVDAIVLLGEVGLIYLLFTVGIELDLPGFKRAPDRAAVFGLTSFFIPFVIGSVGGHLLLGLEPLAAVLLAAVFASHTLLAYPVVNRIGVAKNRAVTAVFGGILFTDTLALIVLALVLGAHEGSFGVSLVLNIGVSLTILVGLVWLVLPVVGRWFFRNFTEESYFEFLFVMAAFFLAASLAELLDIAPILGAFIAGLALNQLISEGGMLHNRIEFAGNAFFIPFFLLHVGMLVDLDVILAGLSTVAAATFIVGTMIATKGVAAQVVGMYYGYSREERGVVFGLSTGQAAAALAITLLGFEAGLFDTAVLNAVVLMLLVTAVFSPWVTERSARRLARAEDVAGGEEAAFDPRILLPLSHTAELQRRLLELTFVLKGQPREEPVHVLTVVQPQPGTDTDARIADARAELEGLEDIASAAEVPIRVESRVNHNIASGIAQAAREEQANLVLIGWDAKMSIQARLFGTIIDHVLDELTSPVMIARLGHPINTTTRLFLLLPRGVIHNEGYFESLYLIKRLTDSLGIDLEVLVVDSDLDPYERSFGFVDPEVPADFSGVDDWDAAIAELSERLDPDDLVAVIGARPGQVGWHDRLEQLPNQLAGLPPESFIVLFPREGDPGYDRKYLRFS